MANHEFYASIKESNIFKIKILHPFYHISKKIIFRESLKDKITFRNINLDFGRVTIE